MVPEGELSYLGNLKSLRVLYFVNYDLRKKLPDEVIKKQIHLRFLGFRACALDEWPASVANLPYLQALDLQYTSMRTLDVLSKRKRLRHLFLPNKVIEEGASRKVRLCGLTGLETLYHFQTKMMEVKDILELTKLRVFTAEVQDTESLPLIINCIDAYWPNLEYADLLLQKGGFDLISVTSENDGPALLRKLFVCRRLHILKIWKNLKKLPKYEAVELASSCLTELLLFYGELEEDLMDTLKKLPNLQILFLGNISFVGKEMVCSATGFPSLTSLVVYDLTNLKYWRIDRGAMPNLSSLEVNLCLELEMVPDGLKFLGSLKTLKSLQYA